jgi:hypothetical protein
MDENRKELLTMGLILGIDAAVVLLTGFVIVVILSRTYSKLEKEIMKSRK